VSPAPYKKHRRGEPLDQRTCCGDSGTATKSGITFRGVLGGGKEWEIHVLGWGQGLPVGVPLGWMKERFNEARKCGSLLKYLRNARVSFRVVA